MESKDEIESIEIINIATENTVDIEKETNQNQGDATQEQMVVSATHTSRANTPVAQLFIERMINLAEIEQAANNIITSDANGRRIIHDYTQIVPLSGVEETISNLPSQQTSADGMLPEPNNFCPCYHFVLDIGKRYPNNEELALSYSRTRLMFNRYFEHSRRMVRFIDLLFHAYCCLRDEIDDIFDWNSDAIHHRCEDYYELKMVIWAVRNWEWIEPAMEQELF